MRYYANFSANDGTSFIKPIESENKNELIKAIRTTAEAERFIGNACTWSVWYIDQTSYITPVRICVASGGVNRYGKRYREKISKRGEIMR